MYELDDFAIALERLEAFLAAVTWLRVNDPGDAA
jgi:hypothetical protein